MSRIFSMIVASFLAFTASAQHVTNPEASLVDVFARIAQLQATHDPQLVAAIHSLRSCVGTPVVTAPTGPMVIPHHYLSGSSGPINPAEAPATAVYAAFERRITTGMNQYLATGSHAEAACALAQMDIWGQAHALMDYDPFAKQGENAQAWYQAEWTSCSAGITLSVLVNDSALDFAQLNRVKQWLNKASHRVIGFERPGRDNNNHHYFRAAGAAAIGIATSDDELFAFAVSTYKEAIDSLDKNGAFPLEMARHENATHYQAFALEPLIPIAELATRQGVNLYAYSKIGMTVYDAIVFFGRAVDDPSLILQYTSDKQKADFGSGDYSDFAALAFFAARFPARPLPASITTHLSQPLTAIRIGGSTTILAAK